MTHCNLILLDKKLSLLLEVPIWKRERRQLWRLQKKRSSLVMVAAPKLAVKKKGKHGWICQTMTAEFRTTFHMESFWLWGVLVYCYIFSSGGRLLLCEDLQMLPQMGYYLPMYYQLNESSTLDNKPIWWGCFPSQMALVKDRTTSSHALLLQLMKLAKNL